MTHSYTKDKIKPVKKVDDDTNMYNENESDLSQCPFCKKLLNINAKHQCIETHFVCSICSISLDKKSKEVNHDGIKYHTMPKKKHYRLVNSLICWNCVFKLVKQMKNDELIKRNDEE